MYFVYRSWARPMRRAATPPTGTARLLAAPVEEALAEAEEPVAVPEEAPVAVPVALPAVEAVAATATLEPELVATAKVEEDELYLLGGLAVNAGRHGHGCRFPASFPDTR